MKQSVLAFLFTLLALAQVQKAMAAESGAAAPACALTDIGDTSPIDTRQFLGKVVYVDFWASWCGPCAKSFPFMNELHRDFKDKGLQLIGINLDENPEDAQAFLAKFPVNFAVAADSDGQCARYYDVKAMPSSYLIGRDGIIRHVHLGFRSGEAKELLEFVEKLLAE